MLRATSPATRSRGRPLTATARPSRARRRAMAAPRPRELPVTKATRPCATDIWRSLHHAQRTGMSWPGPWTPVWLAPVPGGHQRDFVLEGARAAVGQAGAGVAQHPGHRRVVLG